MKSNLYAHGKAIISEHMVLRHWWTKDYDFDQLVKWFGLGALRRGVEEARAAGETIPNEVLTLITDPL